jgi:hypothetical protein
MQMETCMPLTKGNVGWQGKWGRGMMIFSLYMAFSAFNCIYSFAHSVTRKGGCSGQFRGRQKAKFKIIMQNKH